MAFPPPYGTRLPMGFPPQPKVPFNGTQKFGFFSPQTQPIMTPRFPTRPVINLNVKKELPQAKPPVTTVFVGNISDASSDELIQKMLTKCGSVNNWKRLQDSNSKFKAFGFCDFEHPTGTLRALRILNDFLLGGKKLTVKADDATSRMLEEYSAKNSAQSSEEDPDEQIREKIVDLIKGENEDLLTAPLEDDGKKENQEGKQSSDSSDESASEDEKSVKKAQHKRTRSRSSSRKAKSRSRKSRTPEKKRHRKHSSDSSSTGYSGTSKRRHRSSRASRSRDRESEDSDVVKERRKLKEEIKRKERSYKKRLEKWEIREQAKKLRQFLEDYEDERDDIKFYRSSSLFERRRNYERERQEDARDRQEEVQEIEELKKQILAENKETKDVDAEARRIHEAKEKERLKTVREHSGSPTPHRPLGHRLEDEIKKENGVTPDEGHDIAANGASSSSQLYDGTKTKALTPGEWATVGERIKDSPKSPCKKDTSTKLVATLQKPSLSRVNGGVFGDDEDEEDSTHQIKKKIKPFEITQEDRIQSMTPEERKKLSKELIERIPTIKEELFAYSVKWECVDENLLEKRIKPWINKKICEYIGEEEPSLVTFICEKIANKAEPAQILGDLSMVLDDEAEVFMIKLWRLIVYESEAKKLGLSGSSGSLGNGCKT
ncbi:PWI domain-containing protein [Ditylenchus destructor]|uniref:PWI domain-containing protein n=1 Tax=Ditylenchus destructor TaxID=166010 RepID=A0AAD4NAL0_9BILA|nr:PWI domain-containing protein [Ditylenchus destructor]